VRRYKNKQMQEVYEELLRAARAGELVLNGRLRVGNTWRDSFWRGYHHQTTGGRPHFVPGSLTQACYYAGKEYRKENAEYVNASTTAGPFGFKDEAA